MIPLLLSGGHLLLGLSLYSVVLIYFMHPWHHLSECPKIFYLKRFIPNNIYLSQQFKSANLWLPFTQSFSSTFRKSWNSTLIDNPWSIYITHNNFIETNLSLPRHRLYKPAPRPPNWKQYRWYYDSLVTIPTRTLNWCCRCWSTS